MENFEVGDAEEQAAESTYLKAHNCRPPPIFIPLIVFAETVVFVCYAVAASKDNNPYNDVTAFSGNPRGSSLTYYPHKRHEVWRF
ncbi:unnamed protein product, partial [Hymenolepis diminuta]|uniref:Uncharacterized protein n=1 Tax=Hymenolepis diminuta TaxID=6216 RepID=A0A0R3SP01_HYMDI